ncbi:MAG: MFS transporter [Rhodospirillaceae bacterium]|nr:MFS transporter [Rhodospirillaceae bacterium]
MTTPDTRPDPHLTPRAEYTAYTTAFLSVGTMPMFHVVGPLWALSFGASPFEIGIAMGARSFLPFLFAIHGGALHDRLGVRRVMIFCALSSAALTLLYPFFPVILALILLQVITGFLHTLGWIGAQTQISQLTKGHPKYMGRFTSASTISNFFTPPLAGFMWDLAGPWGAFSLLSVWCVFLWISVMLMPVPDTVTVSKGPPSWRAMLPSIGDYRDALRLALIPAVGFVIAGSFLINSMLSVRFSFLPVYMESIGFEGTVIGFMVGLAFLVGSITALPTARLRRLFPAHWILVCVTLFAATGLGIIPFFDDLEGLVFVTILFGAGVGLGMALAISLLSSVISVDQLGLSVGLRITANRFSSFSIPILAGAIIDVAGLAMGFYVTATLIAAGSVCTALYAWCTPSIKHAYGRN